MIRHVSHVIPFSCILSLIFQLIDRKLIYQCCDWSSAVTFLCLDCWSDVFWSLLTKIFIDERIKHKTIIQLNMWQMLMMMMMMMGCKTWHFPADRCDESDRKWIGLQTTCFGFWMLEVNPVIRRSRSEYLVVSLMLTRSGSVFLCISSHILQKVFW